MSQIGDDDSRQVGNYLSILKEHSIRHALNCTYFPNLYLSSIGWTHLVVFINTYIQNLPLPIIYTYTIYFYYMSALNYDRRCKLCM